MKKALRSISILLALCTVFALASCGKSETTAMKLGSSVITEGTYRYWLSSYKAQFMNQYSDMSDSDEFWDQILYDEVSAESFLGDLVNEYVRMNLVTMYLFDEYGLKISREDKKHADDIISDMKDASGGGKDVFEAALAQYGVNEKTLRQIYLDEFKSTYVYNYVFENGVAVVTDADRQDFLEYNYVRVRHIYINNEYNYDESSYDTDGNFIKVPLDAETQARQDRKAEEVRAALAEGADFDEVYKKYSEESAYPNGYYVCESTEGLPDGFTVNAFSLEENEYTEFRSEYGTHFIKRLEMDDGAWDDKANADFFESFSDSVYEDVFMDLMRSYFDKIEVNDEVINAYSIRDALPNWSFQY